MTGPGTLTRTDLAEGIHQETGLARADAKRIVDQIIAEMCNAFERGENVKLSGFGTFVVRDTAARVGRNPKTMVEAPITARRVLAFRPSRAMRDRIYAAGPRQASEAG